jgi:hypothetical protein
MTKLLRCATARGLTSQFLLPSSSATERAQPPNEFLKVNRAAATTSPPPARSAKRQEWHVRVGKGVGSGGGRKGCGNKSHALFIKDGDHARRERVVGYLWDLQELVAVY